MLICCTSPKILLLIEIILALCYWAASVEVVLWALILMGSPIIVAAQQNWFVSNGVLLPSGQSLAVHKKVLDYKLTRINLVSYKQCMCAYMYWHDCSVCTVPAVCEELNPQYCIEDFFFSLRKQHSNVWQYVLLPCSVRDGFFLVRNLCSSFWVNPGN